MISHGYLKIEIRQARFLESTSLIIYLYFLWSLYFLSFNKIIWSRIGFFKSRIIFDYVTTTDLKWLLSSNKSTDAFLIVYELGWNNKYLPTEIIVLCLSSYIQTITRILWRTFIFYKI